MPGIEKINGTIDAIQHMATARDEKEAHQILEGMKIQVDYLGGRIIPPSPQKPGWRVQTFSLTNDDFGRWLPEGSRHVKMMVPRSIKEFKLDENKVIDEYNRQATKENPPPENTPSRNPREGIIEEHAYQDGVALARELNKKGYKSFGEYQGELLRALQDWRVKGKPSQSFADGFWDYYKKWVEKSDSPKPKRNPRPPVWENKTFVATQGIGGIIYFGYKQPPGEFKTKKARRESGAKLYKNYHAFIKKYNLKPDGKLSEQRKVAYETGGNKKLKAVLKRTSKLPKPKAPTVQNPKARNLSGRELKKAIRLYTKFHGYEPDEIKVIKLGARSTLIWIGEGKNITYQAQKHDDDKVFNHSHDIEGRADVYWDMANEGFFIKGRDLEPTAAGIEG
jgi:hypothetical protein